MGMFDHPIPNPLDIFDPLLVRAGGLFAPSQEEATKRSLHQLLTAHANERANQALARNPDQFANQGMAQPGNIGEAASQGMFSNPETIKFLLSLLQQHP